MTGAAPVAGARPYLVLAAGMAAVSGAAVIISLARAEGVPALAIAALRCALAAAVFLPLAIARHGEELRRLSLRDVAGAAGAGLLLALHFASWISSLDHISVMSSVALVSTSPLFVALATVLVLRERLSPWTVAGMAVAVAGAAVVALSDTGAAAGGVPGSALRGDLLALAGAAAGSGYLLVGRSVRRRLSLVPYVSIAYTTAAVALAAAALALRVPLGGWSVRGWLLVAGLAVSAQVVGHTAYNYALRHVSAAFVTVTLMAEPVGSTVLAVALLGQVPTPLRIAGGVLILSGIWLAARAEGRTSKKSPQGM